MKSNIVSIKNAPKLDLFCDAPLKEINGKWWIDLMTDEIHEIIKKYQKKIGYEITWSRYADLENNVHVLHIYWPRIANVSLTKDQKNE